VKHLIVYKSSVNALKVGNAEGKSTPYHFFRDVIAAATYPLGNSVERNLYAGQPNKYQGYEIAFLAPLGNEPGVRSAAECRLKRKAPTLLNMASDFLKHDATCLNRSVIGSERSQAYGY
jgi:hypothetical protein